MAFCEEGFWSNEPPRYREYMRDRLERERLMRMSKSQRRNEIKRLKRQRFVTLYGNLWEKYENNLYGFRRLFFKKNAKAPEVPRTYEYSDSTYKEYPYKDITVHTFEDGSCVSCGNNHHTHYMWSINNDESIRVGVCGECVEILEDYDRYNIGIIDYTGENNIYE